MLRCVTKQDDTSGMRKNKVSRNAVFGEWKSEVCAVLRESWVEAKWGAC